ncbi:MAG: ABC transporter permease [Dongiaceae bacterium]
MRRPPSFWIGAVLVAAFLVLAVIGPSIAPYAEADAAGDAWQPPSAEFLLGTDNLGRDVLSRLLYGTRRTIGIALSATLLSFAIGMTLGFVAAVSRGAVDQAISRVVDVLMSIPTLIFALVVLSLLPHSTLMLVLVMAVLDSTRVFRLARSVARDVAVLEFVEAARLRGEGLAWVIRREILPNTLTPIISEFGLRFCFVILFLSALSFLGLGIQPPQADWGGMVRENANALGFGLFMPLIPAAAIVLLTVSVNLLVDWQLARRLRR